MRRLIVEFSAMDVGEFLNMGPLFQEIESLEMLTFLRDTPDESAIICRVVLKDPTIKIDRIDNGLIEIRLLDREADGTGTYFVKARRQAEQPRHDLFSGGGFVSTPYKIEDGKLQVSFLGSQAQIRRLLQAIGITKLDYRVVSITDAKFSPNSPLSHLTAKQRSALISAYRLGYFDTPRQVKTKELARKLDLAESTAVIHLRRAEKRLLTELIDKPQL